MKRAMSLTAGELVSRGLAEIPAEFRNSEHLVYSSPATLAFNSPGAQGFGVKRAGLTVPESVMLLVAPACCGRNTSVLGSGRELSERFYYLLLDDTDIVTGRYLSKIPAAVKEVVESRERCPRAVMICVTCVDALLGTDMVRLCRQCSDVTGIPVAACTMYALTRDGLLPPMVSVRQSIYSLLKPSEHRNSRACNIIGYFSPLQDGCELRDLLIRAGVDTVRELSSLRTYDEFQRMSEANFNLVLSPEARNAAEDMRTSLGITYLELPRLYQTDKIRNLYAILGNALGVDFEVNEYERLAVESIERLRGIRSDMSVSVGEWSNAEPFELSLSLLRNGFRVPEIFGTVGEGNRVYLRKIAEISPDTRIYSNLSPTMMFYDHEVESDVTIGRDAGYYHSDRPNVPWAEECQPFGFYGVRELYRQLSEALG